MKDVRCADGGMACDFVAQAETGEDLMRKVAAHAIEKDGIIQASPGLTERVKNIMRDVK
jgi:predicted small metal-binding protein